MRNVIVLSLVFVVCMLACVGVKRRNVSLSPQLGPELVYQLDSIFVTDKKSNTSFLLGPYIFFEFSIKNRGPLPADVAIRTYSYETPTRLSAIAVHGDKIFELFAAASTPNAFSIPGDTSILVTLNIDPIPLEKFYQTADTLKYEKWVITSDYLRKMEIHFNWDGKWKILPISKEVPIIFNTLPDNIAVEWK